MRSVCATARRKVVQVTEVCGMEGETIVLQDIFTFENGGFRDGKVLGELKATGIRPRCYEQILQCGLTLPPDLFGKRSASFR